jgi:hypothetical protein
LGPLYQVTNCYTPLIREYKLIREGKAETKDEIPFSFSIYESCDGVRFSQWTELYNSPERAGKALEERLQMAEIITREPMLDEKWKQIGEKMLIEYAPVYPHQDKRAALFWTNGSSLTGIQSSTIENLTEFEKFRNQ